MDTDRYIKIRGELEEIKGMIRDVSNQMQELRSAVGRTPITTEMLSMPEPYIHPWWKHQWSGSVSGGNNLGSKVSPNSTSPN